MSTFSRRAFLKSTGLLGGGLGLLPTNILAGTSVLGLPYYKQGAPFTNDLRRGGGNDLVLQGVIYGNDGRTPLANAVLEIWHCNQQGQFDFSKDFSYRGKTQADKNGKYKIATQFPGKYKENGHLRMSRIFILVNGEGHRESFSQLYFDLHKNPYIDNKHWAACPMAERPSLPKRLRSENQTLVTYDHYLTGFALLQVAGAKEVANQRVRIYPNHFEKKSYLTFGKSRPGHVSVRLVDKQNQVVQKHFFKNVSPEQGLEIGMDNLSAGLYTCSIYSSRFGRFTRNLNVG